MATTSKRSTSTNKRSTSKTRSRSTSRRKAPSKRKYGRTAQSEVKKEIYRYKKGTALSGRAKKPVKSRQQAIAIGLSKARKKGAKVPSKPTG